MNRLCPKGHLVPSGQRCRLCERERSRSRPTATQRGYGADWQRRSAELRAAEPWCHNPRCPYDDVGSARNPLTVHHIRPVSLYGGDGPLTVLCRRCNASFGAREPGR